MHAIGVLAFGLSVAAFAPSVPGAGSAPAPKRNVLLVVVDDLGVDALGLYGGNGAPPTPRIDELASRGVVFRNAFANPMCSPTRAQIQTGRHGFRTGIGGLVNEATGALPTSEVVLPEMLDLGTGGAYAHAAFGKWHLGNASVGGLLSPNVAGYDHFSGTLHGLFAPNSYDLWTRIEDGVESPVAQYATSAVVDAAIDWIAARTDPWLAYVALHAPHKPYHVPPSHLHSVVFPEDRDLRTLADARPYFEAALEALDTEVGRLVDSLPTHVLVKTTIVLVGDNGTASEAVLPPLLPHKAKNSLYEGGIHVPLVVVGPDVVAPGREVTALVSAVDLFATVADAAGVDLAGLALPTLDSVSLLPYLADPAQAPLRETVFAERFAPNGGPPTESQRAIRNVRYKLIERDPGVTEFFDLELDPLEENPLDPGAMTPEQAAARADLESRLAALLLSP